MAQTYAPLAGSKEWSGTWYTCCGDCDEQGWGVCFVSACVPYVLYGWNRSRAFATSGLKWGLLFLIPYVLLEILSSFGEVGGVAEITNCSKDFEKCKEIISNEFDALETATSAVGIISCILVVVIIGLGWWNRAQLRAKYGLAGNHCCDCVLWTFCAPCALCQESRTLMANNVENAVWMGPDVMLVSKSGAEVV